MFTKCLFQPVRLVIGKITSGFFSVINSHLDLDLIAYSSMQITRQQICPRHPGLLFT